VIDRGFCYHEDQETYTESEQKYMNRKEIREIRRRFNPDYDSISRIYGCYVNAAGQIVSHIDISIGLMEKDEAEMYLKLLKKGISGTLGKNLLDIEFSTKQVEQSDSHKLLQALRLTHLQDESLRDAFYQRVIESVNMGEDSFVILMASDSYDVPYKGSDDEIWKEGSDDVFQYFVCCICPVKDAKAALSYQAEEKSFRGACIGHMITAPEIGFMFPAFDDRAANIYNLLYYSKNTAEIHTEFIQGVFNTDKIPMSAGHQKNIFGTILSDALGKDCDLEVVKAVHSNLRDRVQIHKESKEPELPELYIEDIDDILENSGVSEEKIQIFNESCERQFGEAAVLNPENLMENKKFEMVTPEVKIKVDPDFVHCIKTQVIDGSKYILIPVGEGVEVNGIDIEVSGNEEE